MATWLNFIIDSCAQPWLADASIWDCFERRFALSQRLARSVLHASQQ